METKYHSLKDGRTLSYMEFGDPTGHPVFYAHGGPWSRLEGKLFHEEALCRKYRFIATDRAGMGESTYLSNLEYYAFVQITQLGISCSLNKLFSTKIGQGQEAKWSFRDVLGVHLDQNSTSGQTRNTPDKIVSICSVINDISLGVLAATQVHTHRKFINTQQSALFIKYVRFLKTVNK